MATRNSKITQDIYQLKVTLLGTKPPIWRRVLVPAALTLAKLHNVLQTRWDGTTNTCMSSVPVSGASAAQNPRTHS